MPKFKLGDIFVRKGGRDTVPVTIVKIEYQLFNEPVYTLDRIRYSSEEFVIGEEALEETFDVLLPLK